MAENADNRINSMNRLKNRALGVMVAVALVGSGSAAMADDLPSAAELAEMDEDEREELDEEDIEAIEEADDDADGDDEEVAESEAEADEDAPAADWETSLRDPITPLINSEGSMGFHNIASAISPGTFTFQGALLGEATGGSNFIRQNDSHRALGANVVVNASFTENVGGHFRLNARNNYNQEFGRPQSMLAQGDMSFGGIGRYEVNNGVWLGGDLTFYVPSSFESVGISGGSTSIRPRAMLSMNFDEMMGAEPDLYIPVVAHANIGYRIDNTETLVEDRPAPPDRIERTAYGISAYDMVEFGLGVEAPLPKITPYLGWTLGIPAGADDDVCAEDRALACVSDVGGSAFPQTLSIGAKGEPVDNMGLHGGFDFGLTAEHAEGLPVTFPYTFHFGVSYTLDPSMRGEVRVEETVVEEEVEVEVEAPRGWLDAVVVDEMTGSPVRGAEIQYVDANRSPQLTDRDTGQFRSYGFEPGTELVLELEHPDYETAYADWEIEEGAMDVEVVMEPLPQTVIVAGDVVGLTEDGDKVALEGADLLLIRDTGDFLDAQSDEEGRFEFELDQPGGLSVAAIADDFVTGGVYAEPEANDELELTIELSALDTWLAERGANQIGLEEKISFEEDTAELAEESVDVIAHVAAVLFENPDLMSVVIQGHTDDRGDDDELKALSEQRAQAVYDALVDVGISPERLSVEGHGADSPLVPNTSSRNREMNRRIEFHLE